jgi:hypothetical protein
VSARSLSPKFHMPSVYRPKNENCFRCKVGYSLTPDGRRVRQEFRLGDDEAVAHQKALNLAKLWLAEEHRHVNTQAVFRDVFPADPPFPPVWTGMPEAELRTRAAILAEPYEPQPGDEADVVPVKPYTLGMAVEAFLRRTLDKVERNQKSPSTYWWSERELRLGLVPACIDRSLPVTGLTLRHVERFCDHWCDLKVRAAESRKGRFGWRSAHNRLDAFAALLRDLDGRENGFVYPPRADRAFEEAKATVAGDLTDIHEYDADRLGSIVRAADDRLRLAIYCALNFGMYECDVGQQLRRRHTAEHGGLASIDGEMYVQWNRHKLKRRQRKMRRDKDKVRRPVLLTHYAWPETLALLHANASPADNPLNLWLLNRDGRPLWRQEPHHKRPVDNISTAYGRLLDRLDVSLPFAQIRKFGSTACESLGSIEVQEMYRGERRAGSSRTYVLQDFTNKLTPFLKRWGDVLRADGVLY